jgi:hypothetical protein
VAPAAAGAQDPSIAAERNNTIRAIHKLWTLLSQDKDADQAHGDPDRVQIGAGQGAWVLLFVHARLDAAHGKKNVFSTTDNSSLGHTSWPTYLRFCRDVLELPSISPLVWDDPRMVQPMRAPRRAGGRDGEHDELADDGPSQPMPPSDEAEAEMPV